MVLLCKLVMRLFGVGTDTDDFCTSILKDFVTIPKGACFSGTARSIILGQLDTCENDVLPLARRKLLC